MDWNCLSLQGIIVPPHCDWSDLKTLSVQWLFVDAGEGPSPNRAGKKDKLRKHQDPILQTKLASGSTTKADQTASVSLDFVNCLNRRFV